MQSANTPLNQLDDLIDWLGYLTSLEYLKDVLIRRHQLSSVLAKSYANIIVPHVDDALYFIHQALSGPPEVSFLPAYYAILNLAKVYILIGPRHAELAKNRWHGVSYDVNGKDSRSLLTEVITVRNNGTLPLFYETLTGRKIIANRKIKMGDVYPCISEIGTEYNLATNRESHLVALDCSVEKINSKKRLKVHVFSEGGDDDKEISVRNIEALKGLAKVRKERNIFVSPMFDCDPDEVDKVARSYLDCRFIYYHPQGYLPVTAITCSNFPMPEEIPIFLLFYHMSSVTRYKPEFLSRIRQSRYWPFIISARRQSLRKFMLLFWSYVNKKQFILNSE